ncbi:MAG: SDR family NAD(P)-dependent oxidoreductase [Nitrosopumilaceae archaeon]|nr:SDR family oxidoreductase [Nitrosopumilaceae archaeon]NIT99951.1 SDR family oxidoreductase [Nitrosopumilaceae archaeon]NIU86305.1 SDR family NAD(P)-dependent oxidoreductase [Nitrosopumilaceae archaeon]NIV65060.1 SDR family NAD(P)-dependent oxidoreductase [Nitrosopumilaceae archaeon]NIX60554.1 SDR family NAD(P)-dependent oxidoreductase [Nitrosopumilaceae archaeon]
MTETVIVTGGNKGIGKAIVEELARNGYNIVITGRNQKLLDSISKKITAEYNVQAIGIAADIKKKREVKKLMKKAIAQFNEIDVLVNNAGILLVKNLEKTTEKEFDVIIDTNLKGVFLCSKEILPHMISRRKGKVINISSGAGKSGFPKISAYCASKFAVNGLTESLSHEVKSFGIDVIAVCPGAVSTDMQKKFMRKDQFEATKNDMIQPLEVAKVVLDSIRGKFRTGTAVDVY